MSECLRFTDDDFQRQVIESRIPVLVDFWASWCPPCKMVEPIVDELARQCGASVRVGKLNIDQNPAVRSEYEISAVPAFVLFSNGKPVRKAIGSQSLKQLRKMVDEALNRPTQPIKSIPSPSQAQKHKVVEEIR